MVIAPAFAQGCPFTNEFTSEWGIEVTFFSMELSCSPFGSVPKNAAIHSGLRWVEFQFSPRSTFHGFTVVTQHAHFRIFEATRRSFILTTGMSFFICFERQSIDWLDRLRGSGCGGGLLVCPPTFLLILLTCPEIFDCSGHKVSTFLADWERGYLLDRVLHSRTLKGLQALFPS